MYNAKNGAMFQIDLSGKTVLITGADSGIGLGISTQMAIAGANISGCALDATGQAFRSRMAALQANALYTSCDVTSPAQQEALVTATVREFGGIDILISNAGQNMFSGAAATDENAWQQNIELNLAAHWRLSKLCKPWLEARSGVIVIITSNHAYQTIPGCFPYNVAKTALTSLVQTLTVEWAPAIRTVGIAPGFIDTPGNQQWFNSFPDPAAERQRTIDLHPVKKLGTVDEIGAWCVFLASPFGGFAAGTTYLVDGGRSALMQ